MSNMDSKFSCWYCHKKFTHKRNVYKHIRQIHKVNLPKQVNIPCPECDEPCGKRSDVRNHLQQVHNIEQISERISFSSMNAFFKWKQERERTTHCSYVKVNGMHLTLTGKKTTFHCHRSGNFRSTGTGKRRLKSQGTNKLGKLCPACIEVTELDDGTIDGIFWKTHVGHFPDLLRLPVPHEEKVLIAKKLLAGMDEKKILQDLKLSMNTEIERKHLITIEDLRNIKQRFFIKISLNKTEIEDDVESVANWVEEMRTTNYNPVLFYKKQNEEHWLLSSGDFFLVIMTVFQKIMSTQFDYDRVCVDTICGISDSNFHLVAIVAANKYEEGIPVAICITSILNHQSLELFFSCIKEVLPDLKPNIFVSDDSPIVYDAWEEVFEPCEERLLCSWKVEQEWQNRLSTIKKKSKRDDIYRSLKTLLYEFDEVSFQEMLDIFTMQLNESEDTQEFYEYFMANYQGRSEMWSYCFRKHAKLNTAMHIETFQKNLKQICLHRRKPRRVDNCIIKLIDLINHKKFHDFITTHIEDRSNETLNDYLLNTDSSTSNIEEKNYWESVSDSNDDTFHVTKHHICDSGCKLCQTVEGYKCTCRDYSISKYVCKHIPFMLKCIQAGDISFLNDSDCNNNKQKFLTCEKELIDLDSIRTQVSLIREKLNSISSLENKVEQTIYISLNTVEQLLQPLVLKKSKNVSRMKRKKSSPTD